MWEDYFTECGSRIYNLHTVAECKGIFKYKQQWEAFWQSHADQYHVVHMHYMSHEGLIAEVAKKYGMTVIAHSHSTVENKITWKQLTTKFININLNKNLNKNADYLLACSRQAGRDFFGREFETRGIVVKNAIDVEKYDFDLTERKKKRNELGVENRVVIGHVGNYVYPKNQDFMLRIFAEVASRKEDAVLLWAGVINDKDRRHLETLMEELHIRDKVILLGRYREIEHLLLAMDVFLFPSLYEGLAIALIEAQTAGLPCIVSDTIPEEAEVTDLFTRVALDKTPREWAETVVSGLQYERHGRKEEVQKRGYGLASFADQMERIYLEAMNRTGHWGIGE
jgi:glycosyltransferase involved in cell wall biosynthesis